MRSKLINGLLGAAIALGMFGILLLGGWIDSCL